MLRRPDADWMDLANSAEIWTRPDVLNKAHGRLRASLDAKDEEIVCLSTLAPHENCPNLLLEGVC